MTLAPYRVLPAGHAWRAEAIALFRAFIDEQGQRDPLYRWDGGSDDALRRTWGGWDTLHLLVEDERPIGLVSWTDHAAARVGRLRGGAEPTCHAVTLTNVYVAPEYRGAGRGRRLLQAARARLSAAPPAVALGGCPRVADRVLAATHGWNEAARRTFASAGWTPELVEWARPADAPFPPTDLDVRDIDAPTDALPAMASWFAVAYGLTGADRRTRPAGAHALRVSRAGQPLLEAAFHATPITRPTRLLVRCTELRATPRALGDPAVVDALHAALRERLGTTTATLRLPLLLTPAASAALSGPLRDQGLTRELIHFATPLGAPALAGAPA